MPSKRSAKLATGSVLHFHFVVPHDFACSITDSPAVYDNRRTSFVKSYRRTLTTRKLYTYIRMSRAEGRGMNPRLDISLAFVFACQPERARAPCVQQTRQQYEKSYPKKKN